MGVETAYVTNLNEHKKSSQPIIVIKYFHIKIVVSQYKVIFFHSSISKMYVQCF